MQSKEIELRDEQVRFLKETILALEQEKDSLANQNAQWKAKLKQMAAEITQYNTTVVQKIYEENQDLLRQVADLELQLEIVGQEREEAVLRLRESEGRVASHSSEKQEMSTVNESLKEARSKQEKRAALLEKENRELQTKNIALQRQLDESSSQIAYCSQQIDVLTQKHHDALKLAEKRLKQTAEKMVPREELERAERDAKDGAVRNKQLRGDLDKMGRENERLKFDLGSCRDRLLSLEVREETRSQQLRIDLVNLSQSVKIGKRVAEF
jgi:chromosome segregation ATPase